MVKTPTVQFSSATADTPTEEVTSGDASVDERGMKVNKHCFKNVQCVPALIQLNIITERKTKRKQSGGDEFSGGEYRYLDAYQEGKERLVNLHATCRY